MFYYYSFFPPYLNNFRKSHSVLDQSIFRASSYAAPVSNRTTDTLILLINPMTAVLDCQLPSENPYLPFRQVFLVLPATKIYYYFPPKLLLLMFFFSVKCMSMYQVTQARNLSAALEFFLTLLHQSP